MKDKAEELNRAFEICGIVPESGQSQAFLRYAELLTDWNSRFNLTAIHDFSETVEKHFIDSIYPFAKGMLPAEGNLLDLGSGAGFPGIPLKIMFPAMEITLLDSLEKRVAFLNHVIKELKLDNIQALHGRAEDMARGELRESFSLVTARAVAPLSVLLEYGIPFLKSGGVMAAYKTRGAAVSECAEAEKAALLLALKPEDFSVIPYMLPPGEDILPGSRRDLAIVKVKKSAPTPEKYPRRAGIPAKRPL